ncbi:Nn.00g115330.m01.CDS01 [Neocucurbitaria sp. VM-36]
MATPVTSSSQIPVSVAERPGEISLTDLLLELRLEIWKHLLDLSNVPRSYGYTGLPARAMPSPVPSFPVPDPVGHAQLPAETAALQHYNLQLHLLEAQCVKRMAMARQEQNFLQRYKQWIRDDSAVQQEHEHQVGQAPRTPEPVKATRTHSMIIVSKQLSSEYRQVYYERTNFFFHISTSNISHGIPHLIPQPNPASSPNPSQPQQRIPNFWPTAPLSLFQNLRNCTLYIELSLIESSIHPLRLHPNGALSTTAFDTRITSALKTLLTSMRQLRTVKIIWSTPLPNRLPLSVVEDRLLLRSLAVPSKVMFKERATFEREKEEMQLANVRAVTTYNWDMFIAPFVDVLIGKRGVRGFMIRVGDAWQEMEYKQQRGEGGKWEPN